jgi:hypothetical protein
MTSTEFHIILDHMTEEVPIPEWALIHRLDVLAPDEYQEIA